MKKMKEDSTAYTKEAIDLAFGFCPTIKPCQKCGHPVIVGYCCITCDDTSEEE